MNEFDLKAKDWDNNPVHTERAEAIAGEIRKRVHLTAEMRGFEFGCGTGLLSFNLSGELKNITLADNSEGMLEVLKRKIEAGSMKNMIPLRIDLEKEEVPGNDFDIIFTQMTLHHVTDIAGIFNKFYSMLQPGGTLCVADLYKEDGSFHGKDFTGHHGFDPEELRAQMEAAGFQSVEYSECHQMKRKADDKELIFPLFLMTGKK